MRKYNVYCLNFRCKTEILKCKYIQKCSITFHYLCLWASSWCYENQAWIQNVRANSTSSRRPLYPGHCCHPVCEVGTGGPRGSAPSLLFLKKEGKVLRNIHSFDIFVAKWSFNYFLHYDMFWIKHDCKHTFGRRHDIEVIWSGSEEDFL